MNRNRPTRGHSGGEFLPAPSKPKTRRTSRFAGTTSRRIGTCSPKPSAFPQRRQCGFSWSNFDRDLEALKKIGVTHYRFSVEWARVEPEPGRYNEAAIRRYAEMARKLKAAGIEPVVTLWHFTFPSWLVTKGSAGKSRWLHPLYRERWPLYVERVTESHGAYRADLRAAQRGEWRHGTRLHQRDLAARVVARL